MITRNLYNCSMQDLYNVCRNANNLMQANIADFTAYKASYTVTFCDNFGLQITAAENLPDAQARDAVTEAGHLALANATAITIDCFNKLEGYIEDAFPTEIKLRTEEAGKSYYTKAANENWSAVQSLLTSACNFVVTHQSTLVANQNMPVGFVAELQMCKTEVLDIYTAMKSNETNNQTLTDQKITANNALYTTISKVFTDAHRIYRNNPTLKSQFSFEYFLGISGQTHVAGIRGHVTDATTNAPIAGVVVESVNHFPVYTTQTDAEGHYEMHAIVAGDYTFQYTKDGYTTNSHPVTIHSSVTSNTNIALESIVQAQPA